MNVVVRMFAGARGLVGQAEVSLEVPDGATIATVKEALRQEFPPLARWPTFQIAVDQEYAADGRVLRGDEELACIPPVSGG